MDFKIEKLLSWTDGVFIKALPLLRVFLLYDTTYLLESVDLTDFDLFETIDFLEANDFLDLSKLDFLLDRSDLDFKVESPILFFWVVKDFLDIDLDDLDFLYDFFSES